jgi:hypothetical protein
VIDSTVFQYLIAAALLAGGAVLLAIKGGQWIRGVAGTRRERTPVDDLRLVIDLAARLRDQGKSQAVAVCQQLLDELLKPEAPQS